jgi:hypothetical protein
MPKVQRQESRESVFIYEHPHAPKYLDGVEVVPENDPNKKMNKSVRLAHQCKRYELCCEEGETITDLKGLDWHLARYDILSKKQGIPTWKPPKKEKITKKELLKKDAPQEDFVYMPN